MNPKDRRKGPDEGQGKNEQRVEREPRDLQTRPLRLAVFISKQAQQLPSNHFREVSSTSPNIARSFHLLIGLCLEAFDCDKIG